MRAARAVTSLALLLLVARVAYAEPLRVACTTPDLASLVTAVGGDSVEVTSFVRGGQDPHFVEARPSFIRVLSRADLLVHVGLQLESGWLPSLLRRARNSRVQLGAKGNLDASTVVPLLGVITGQVDRSMGDVHVLGNPHYLVDPLNGLRVARALEARLSALRPAEEARFRANADAFAEKLLGLLVGKELVRASGVEPLADALLAGALPDGVPPTALAGWLGAMRPRRGQPVVADHDLWPYFAARFGIEVVAFLEPLPGITPTTRHLSDVAALMQERRVRVILSASYFHPRYAKKVAKAAGAQVVEMANQVGARQGTDDYLAMVDWNVRHVADALE